MNAPGCTIRIVWLLALTGGWIASAPAQPTILAQPFNQAACVGASATFTVVAAGAAPLAFQWRRDGLNVFDEVVTNAYSKLTLTNVQPGDADSHFDVVVTDSTGSVTSASVKVHFPDPAIKTPPGGLTFHEDTSIQLSVDACGTPPLRFQWFFNDAPLVSGGAVSGATNPMLTINPANATFAGWYHAVVYHTNSAIQTEAVECLMVSPPVIVTQPVSQRACPGGNAEFRVSAVGIPAPEFYWRRDGTNVDLPVISTPTNSVLLVTNVFPPFEPGFDVVVTNVYGAVTSHLADLDFFLPGFLHQPTNTVASTGEVIRLYSESCDPFPFATYQWFKNGFALSNSARIAGVNTNRLVISNALSGDTGDYQVAIADQFGNNSSTSYVARCFVGTPPSIGSLTSRVVRFLANTTFNPAITANPPRVIQWFRNGVPIPFATNLTLNRTGIRPHVGRYHVVVANDAGTAVSEPAHLQVRLSLEGTAVVYFEEATDELPSLTNAVPSLFSPPATTLFHGVPLLFTTSGATAQAWETNRCGVAPVHSMWLRYHARDTNTTLVTTEGSGFNTVLGVYSWTLNTNDDPVLLICDDNSGYDGYTSRLVFSPTAYTDYFIAVDGVNGATGTVRLRVGEPIRNMVYTNGTFRFEFTGDPSKSHTLRTVGVLSQPPAWSNLISVAATVTNWVRGYTNPTAAADLARFYTVNTNSASP